MELKNLTTTKWWICYNADKSVIQKGKTEPNEILKSGLSGSETFDTELSWKNRLTELGVSLTDKK